MEIAKSCFSEFSTVENQVRPNMTSQRTRRPRFRSGRSLGSPPLAGTAGTSKEAS